MENNNDNNRKKSSFMKIMGSKVSDSLSVVMIIVAFLSFLVIGLGGNESYAIETNEAGFDTRVIEDYAAAAIYTGDGDSSLVPLYTSNGQQIYCLEYDKGMPTFIPEVGEIVVQRGVHYTQTDTSVDRGILYIASIMNITDVSTGQALNNNLQTWIKQIAVWDYLNEIPADVKSSVTSVDSVWMWDANGTSKVYYHDANNNNLYNTYVKPILDKAKNVKNDSLTVSKTSDLVELTEDGKYYQTQMFNVNFSTDLNNMLMSYELSFPDSPENIEVYTEDGQRIEDLSNVTQTKFFLRVPADKVTEDAKVVHVSVKGHINGYTAGIFAPEDPTFQHVVLARPEISDINSGVDLDIKVTTDAPDTRMSVTQSVYFIGLVILLCGIGIIYANTKPSKSE